MCPSIQGTQEMLNVCEKYANTHKIKFNVSKSQIIVFNHNKYNNFFQVNSIFIISKSVCEY